MIPTNEKELDVAVEKHKAQMEYDRQKHHTGPFCRCNKCHDTGYTGGVRVICDCISRDQRQNTITLTRDGFPPVAIDVYSYAWILKESKHECPVEFQSGDGGELICNLMAKLLHESEVIRDERAKMVTVHLTIAEACAIIDPTTDYDRNSKISGLDKIIRAVRKKN